MLKKSTMMIAPVAIGLLCLSACATTTPSADKMADAKVAQEVSEDLSQTKRTMKSEDGKMICKRTTVVGSKFNKKVCATADEWAARAEADKKTTAGIQRSAGPGTSN